MLVLGIETSCDETGLALYDSEQGLLGDELFSQIDIHQDYGGVVPELASRDHADRVLPLLQNLLKNTNKSLDDIDLIAYTAGPGLKGCLLVGSTFARSLAFIIDKPIISVNHVEAHLLAPFMEYPELTFPFFGLLISGGHTMIVDAKSIGEYEIMGETLDDAIGEAFDKSAKLMGLEYPGGPLIEKLAKHKVAPPLLGFGISTPEQVAHAIHSGAAGAISGSATVNIIAKHLDNTPAMLSELGEFVQSMKAGTSKA